MPKRCSVGGCSNYPSDTVSVFHIADEMKERNWYVQPQLAFGCSPEELVEIVKAFGYVASADGVFRRSARKQRKPGRTRRPARSQR